VNFCSKEIKKRFKRNNFLEVEMIYKSNETLKPLFPKSFIAVGIAVMLFASCGNGSKKEEAQIQPQQPETQSQSENANTENLDSMIPNAAVVRVPVNEEGEAIGEPEMHIYHGDIDIGTDDGVEQAFKSGTEPVAFVDSATDELDLDSSTQSWTNYRYGAGNSCARARGNYSYGASCYNNNYFHSVYRPRMFWRGNFWNYGHYRPYTLRRAGYRYHCYRPQFRIL
jgi:hypothetical protein